MRLRTLALDFDGTIAVDGRLDGDVRRAIARAREQLVTVVLVTGRILADLERLLGDLRLFDAVVAENGAVLYFPASERALLLATPPPAAFLDELRCREIPFLAGECVVEMDASRAPAALATIRDMELPLAQLFNRGRMMILPQAVSKATGLREALRALRLSSHNAVGVGDAENDHELLAVCELGVAVAWGSPALKAAADEVLAGHGPPAVARLIHDLLREPRIAAARLGRRRLHLGVRQGGEPFEIAMRGRNVLIAGDTQSGKSWTAGILCEQLVLKHYCVCVIDPEGEYCALESLPSVVLMNADPHAPDLADVERTLRYPDVSVVLDLSALEMPAKCDYVERLLARLRDLRRRTGLPHRIVIDEAHYFLRESCAVDLLDLELGGFTLVTWHASQLHERVLESAEAIIVTGVSDADEARALHALRGRAYSPGEWARTLGSLERQHAALLPGADESGDRIVTFHVSARLTPHIRHLHKYGGTRAPPGRAFLFTGEGIAHGREAHSLADLVAVLSLAPDVSAYLQRHDFSRWIRDAFGDALLADSVRDLEDRAASGCLDQPHQALIEIIRDARADLVDPARPA